MNCEDCQERLLDFACDALAPEEQAKVRAHLATGCHDCQEQLDAWRESCAALALSAPRIEPPAALKGRVLARIRESELPAPDPRASASIAAAHKDWNWRAFVPYVAVSICAIAAGIAAVRWTDHRLEQQAALAQEFAQRMREAEESFPSARMRFASHRGADDASTACYLLLDPTANELHFHAVNLGVPEAGKRFELWLVSREGSFLRVGTLPADAQGNCAATLPLPPNAQDVVRAVVTEESALDTSPQGPERVSAPFVD